MNEILDRKIKTYSRSVHSFDAIRYCLSRMLERAAYYGLRAILVLYMIGETINLPKAEAFSIYGLLGGALMLTQILGAVLGDLVIGNKQAIISGAILQAVGAFVLSIPNTFGVYLGIILIAIGSGFYSPNISSNFGKCYLNRKRLLDAGYTILYIAVNVGATIGVVLIGLLGEKFGFRIGFLAAGILLVISILPLVTLKEKEIETREYKDKFSGWNIDSNI